MFDIGVPELVLVLIIVLVLFGGKKIPELTRSLGEAVKEFKNGLSGKTSASEASGGDGKSKETKG